jgi:hypothetical protein
MSATDVVPGLPPVQVVSDANGSFAIEANFSTSQCTLEANAPTNPAQRWEFVYFGTDGCAMVIDGPSGLLALAALPGVNYPQLLPFTWDQSYLWAVPPMDGAEGISTLRDGSFCLTIENQAVQAGSNIQYYNWKGLDAQQWTLTPAV